MIGKYTLYTPDGPLEVENIITRKGKELILKHLAQDITDWAGVMAVGVSDIPATENDTRLGYEIGRGDIDVATVDVGNDRVIVKGTIPANVIGNIREIGVFSSGDEKGSGIIPATLSDFDVAVLDVTGFVADETAGRIGVSAARLTVNASSTTSGRVGSLSFPMEGYDTLDNIILAYHHPGGITSAEVKFFTSATDYFSYTFAPAGGYNFVTWTKGAMTVNGAPSWLSPVNAIELSASAGTGGGSLALDGMTVYTVSEIPDYGLVSRAVIAYPQDKIFAPMDVEYAVEFGW